MSGRRTAILVALAVVVGARALGGSALAAGHRALIPVKPPGVARLKNQHWVQAGDGSTYVTANGVCGRCDEPEFIFRFGPNGGRDADYGGKGYVELLRKERFSGFAIDSRGRALVAWREGGVRVLRLTLGGHPDPGFGDHGVASLPELGRGRGSETPKVNPMPGGGLLVSTETNEGRAYAHVHLEELREDGNPDGRFGKRGVSAIDVAGSFHLEEGPTVLSDGSILIGSECCSSTVRLTRVSARGRLDTGFDQTARRTLRHLTVVGGKYEEGPELFDLVPGADGGVDLFGRLDPRGFELEMQADGRPEAGFGRDGLKVLRLPVSRVAPLPEGGFFATGLEFNEPTVAFVLRGNGDLDRRFRPTSLGPGSYEATPTVIRDGRVSVAYGVPTGPEEFQYRPLVDRFAAPMGEGAGR